MLRPSLSLLLGVLLTMAFALSSADLAQAIPRLAQCANNVDDDGDGKADFPADPECRTSADNREVDPTPPPAPPRCADGIDNDIDGRVDYPHDPGCARAADNNEPDPPAVPECADGVNNDPIADSTADYPDDPGCIAASDVSETNTACSDGLDNDSDGNIDFPSDWGCAVPSVGPDQTDASEDDPPQCNDGRDNDGDRRLDTDTNVAGQMADPGCSSPADPDETDPPRPACWDGIDNDSDGLIDFPTDRGCVSRLDADETDAPAGTPAPPGAPGGVPQAPSSSASTRYPLISPFPVVRLRGKVHKRGVTITLLRVQAPNGSRVTVYCYGRGCRPRKTSQTTVRGFVRVRRFERRLRAGTTLTVYVTRRGFTGKYTRFRIRKNRPPGRFDSCARSAGARSVACPVN